MFTFSTLSLSPFRSLDIVPWRLFCIILLFFSSLSACMSVSEPLSHTDTRRDQQADPPKKDVNNNIIRSQGLPEHIFLLPISGSRIYPKPNPNHQSIDRSRSSPSSPMTDRLTGRLSAYGVAQTARSVSASSSSSSMSPRVSTPFAFRGNDQKNAGVWFLADHQAPSTRHYRHV